MCFKKPLQYELKVSKDLEFSRAVGTMTAHSGKITPKAVPYALE